MIAVLRLGHRIFRDKRVTTHVALVARAFGADKIFVSTEDKKLEKGIDEVTARFGGSFRIVTGVNWRRTLKEWNGTKVHLTMYGEHIDDVLHKIPNDNILIVVGAEKVPAEVYKLADYNISIGSQPHSEVAALAVFLDRLSKGKGLKKDFSGKLRILPGKKEKRVLEIISDEECIEILKRVSCEGNVIEHCKAVQRLAVKIAYLTEADVDLVSAGALLHDIGRSRTHSIDHGVEGAKIAKELKLPKPVVHIIERHIGAGISKQEAKELGLPLKDYVPRTIEEKIVAHADNLMIGRKKRRVEFIVEKMNREGHQTAANKILRLHRELSKKCGVDIDEIDV
jgi:tRNA (cytidine56-2'-O)-methyltransferase